MGRYVTRQTPKPMPSVERIQSFTQGLRKPFIVAGSRGVTAQENRQPRFDVHSQYRLVGASMGDLKQKRLVFFVHGYNNTPDDALRAARNFFGNLDQSIIREQIDTNLYEYVLFTWPGDTGPVYFNDAQEYAQHSGVALYNLLKAVSAEIPPGFVSLVSHSLGAHVVLRSLAVLGERFFRDKSALRVNRALLLAAAVEDDVFERPSRAEEYHFPESAFGLEYLHIGVSRSDEVLGGAFRVNEKDIALGFSGPQSMEPLASLSRRVSEVSENKVQFSFEVHDFSPSSATIMNPELQVRNHGDYWRNQRQTDYYVNLIAR